jgi:hypothetical protein
MESLQQQQETHIQVSKKRKLSSTTSIDNNNNNEANKVQKGIQTIQEGLRMLQPLPPLNQSTLQWLRNEIRQISNSLNNLSNCIK